jgi:hypothetical protein
MRNDKKLGGALMAIAFVAASTVVEAGKGNGGGRQGGGYSTGGSSMSGSGYTYNYGSGTRNDNQYQHRHQHQYRHKHGSDSAWSDNTGTENRYSDDRRLSQKDFQTWLSQGENRNGQPGSGKR